MTWFEAVSYCKRQGAKLAEINSEEENRVIKEKIVRGGYQSRNMWFWIGLTDRSEEGTWRYASNGEVTSFFNWDKHYPLNPEPNNDNNNEHCALIRSRGCTGYVENGWADLSCSEKTVKIKCVGDWLKTKFSVNALCEFKTETREKPNRSGKPSEPVESGELVAWYHISYYSNII